MIVNKDRVIIIKKCPLCGGESCVTIGGINPLGRLHTWMSGELVQKVFPELSANEREILISGTHPWCFDEAFDGWKD